MGRRDLEKWEHSNGFVIDIFRPPELLLGTTKYGPAVDMWSVGCIFAEFLMGRSIFPGRNEVINISLKTLFSISLFTSVWFIIVWMETRLGH